MGKYKFKVETYKDKKIKQQVHIEIREDTTSMALLVLLADLHDYIDTRGCSIYISEPMKID